MANSKKQCKHCKDYFPAADGVKLPAGWFHEFNCALLFAANKQDKDRTKAVKKANKEFNRETKRLKKKIKSRAAWYGDLQIEVNKYVRLTQADKPCCTCGTTNPSIKYDAGHFLSVGARKELRFELTNIHKQCSVYCNQFGSGMRYEYTLFIIKEYGQDHLDWLNGPHPSLKEVFPTHEDIEIEIARYRKLNREIVKES